jgi:hypothetical protein
MATKTDSVVGRTVWWYVAKRRQLMSGVIVSAIWHENQYGLTLSKIWTRRGPNDVCRLHPRSREVWWSEEDALLALEQNTVTEPAVEKVVAKSRKTICADCVSVTEGWHCREYQCKKNHTDPVTGNTDSWQLRWCASVNMGTCKLFRRRVQEVENEQA